VNDGLSQVALVASETAPLGTLSLHRQRRLRAILPRCETTVASCA